MSSGSAGRTVAMALAEVARRRAEEEELQRATVAAAEEEIRALQAQLAELRQRVEVRLAELRELQLRASDREGDPALRSREAVLGALRDQAILLADRQLLVEEAQEAREAQVASRLASPELAKLVSAYQRFRESEAQLSQLDEIYTRPLFEAHSRVKQDLQGAISAVEGRPVRVDGDPISADLVYAVDRVDGGADLLVMLLPVAERDLLEGREGVALWVYARALQAVHEASVEADWYQVQADSGGYLGLVVVEVDVAGAPDAWVSAFEERLRAAFDNPPELLGARVAVVPTAIEMDYLIPPDSGGTGPEGEEGGDVG